MEQVPYGFKNELGTETGVLFDIALELQQASQSVPSLALTQPYIIPTKRIISQLNQAHPVCTLVAESPIIADHFDLIEPIGFQLKAGILPAAGITLTDYQSLNDKSIAVPLGIMFDRRFHDDDDLNKVSVREYYNGIKMLAAGRVDSVAGAIPSLYYNAKMLDIPAATFGEPLLFVDFGLFLVCNDQLPQHQRELLKNLVIELKSNGSIPQLFESYFDLNS